MATQLMLEKWSGQVTTVIIGATAGEGGGRASVIKIGGEQSLPFLSQEGAVPNKPQIAFEIWDIMPTDWPAELSKPYADVWSDPLAWAEKCVKGYNAQALCIRLLGAHPDFGNRTPDQEAKLIAQLLKKITVPLIILGSADDAKDNLVLPACCQAARGERCLIG
ncbi:MAG: acetyl-CoA decarbonylase/synthase complex subunit delta, partial [Candidatus Omnitrophica bacterium]|nr:acetyl-CoA decarbonylase/synthase complex subunit delta [Candidatus Omnitrophota bacterium]